MTDISTTLESIILDPRSEQQIVEQAKLRVFNASGGQLDDFTENSPVAALIEGQAFAAAELLYYVNRLPIAFVIDFLKVLGVQRRLGTKAAVTLTFNLAAPLGDNFVIPTGFEVVDLSGNYSFLTDTNLTIPPGLVSGSVTATAEAVGAAYNLAAFTITGPAQPLTFLASVSNLEASNGGSDAETDAEVITRGLTELRVRSPISAADFETLSEGLLGSGSVCKAIGLLGPNRAVKQLGAIHLFLLNANKEPANSAQLLQVQQYFADKVPLGSSLYTSPMELMDISAELIANVVSGRSPDDVADELWQAYRDALDPSSYPAGQDVVIGEIEFALRSTGGIQNVSSFTLNGQPLNIPVPNDYTLPDPSSLVISLVSNDGAIFEYAFGKLEGDDYADV